MKTPEQRARELARCQGFPDRFRLPASESKAVKLIGNSVPPPLGEALLEALLAEELEYA